MVISPHRAGAVLQGAAPAAPRSFEQRRRLLLILMGLPAVLYVLGVALWPIAQGLYFSLFNFNLTRPGRVSFAGFDNYLELFRDASTRRAILNTLLFTVGAVAIELVCGMGIALLLWADGLFNRICLAIVLIPVTITPLAVALIFRALLEPDFGLVGYTLRKLQLSPPGGFLASEQWALVTLIFIDVWQWTPLMALILLAGLKSLPTDVLEAADIDGARRWRKFTRVILPMMGAPVLLALIMRTMDAFKVYDSVLAATGGGPNDATNVLMFQAAKLGFEFFEIGASSAVSSFMLLCIGVMAAVFIWLMHREEVRAGTRPGAAS